ncbi:MAG: DegT/DnrJ/EryC1/StrS family aminotransferase [Phycisphaerae bacterium]
MDESTVDRMQIPLSRPDVTEAEIEAVVSVLRTDRLSLGPHLAAFEAAVAERAGRKYGIGVNSGTSGLHLCVRALGIGEGDEVITTPFSFIATTNCILFERATPVFVDIDPETYNLDPTKIEAAITPRTKAILPVEVFGNTTHFDGYERIAEKHGLAMIEDSCEALGGYSKNRPAGSFGNCSVFGFYPNKQITAGEGGVVVTDNRDLRDKCLSMRNQGRKNLSTFCHEMVGYNYRLNELSAVMGEVQMARLDEILDRRRAVAHAYNECLADMADDLILPPCGDVERQSWFVYVVRLRDSYTPEARAELMGILRDRGIGCEQYFRPIHTQPYMKKQFGFRKGQFPICEAIAARTIALPFFTQMSENQVSEVVSELKDALAKVTPSKNTAVSGGATESAPDEEQPLHRVPYFRLRLEGNEQKYIKEVLDSGWLTTASKTRELEKRFARTVDAKHACAVNSCTAALHLALEALGVGPGDKVIVPTMTFTASAEVVRYLGADPIFCDVEYGSSLVTPDIMEAALKAHPDAKAAVVVHFGGQPAELYGKNGPGILDVCRKHGVKVVEDAAHAFPARLGERMVGSLGDVTCFSFYANKTITSGEGGMLVTDDEAIAKRASVMRLHGIDRDIWGRFTKTSASWEYDVVAPGYKYNMPDLNAAVGLAQLEQGYALWEGRHSAAEYYYKHLSGMEHLDLPLCHVPLEDHAWHLFPVIVKPSAPIDRNEVIEKLNTAGIGTSVHYKPLHRMTYYRNRYQLDPSSFPQAERIWQGTMSLPLFPCMTKRDLQTVCDHLRQLLG